MRRLKKLNKIQEGVSGDKTVAVKKIARAGKFYVYILECKDKTYYTGYTTDIEKRIKEHNGARRGAKYTRARGPVKVVYLKEYRYYRLAVSEEARIKKLRRYQKEKIVREYCTE